MVHGNKDAPYGYRRWHGLAFRGQAAAHFGAEALLAPLVIFLFRMVAPAVFKSNGHRLATTGAG